jgi:hypothetical protein
MNDELSARQRAISLRLAGWSIKQIGSALGREGLVPQVVAPLPAVRGRRPLRPDAGQPSCRPAHPARGWFQGPLLPRRFRYPGHLRRELARLQEAVNTQHVHPLETPLHLVRRRGRRDGPALQAFCGDLREMTAPGFG